MRLTKFAVSAIALSLTACSYLPRVKIEPPPVTMQADAQVQYQQALAKYRESQFDAALTGFAAAVATGQLKSEDEVNARKHIAFIHCSNGRELPCREQFQAILKAEPAFELAANEASHPVWGPVWRSVKGAAEEQRVIAKASGLLASAAQQKLAEGLKQYEDGDYKQAVDSLQNALKAGLPARIDQVIAHKYTAFSYCLMQRRLQCRAEFRKLFALDPAFALLPSESGHPAWASSYRSEKAAAVRRAKKK